MQSPEQLEMFRRMSPAQRLEIWRQLTDLCYEIWVANHDAAEIERRWAAWRREHDLSDREMLRGFRACS